MLFKKKHFYTNRDGKEAWAWNFFIDVGGQKIPVAVVRFTKDGKPDNGYNVRVALLASIATEIVDDPVEK